MLCYCFFRSCFPGDSSKSSGSLASTCFLALETAVDGLLLVPVFFCTLVYAFPKAALKYLLLPALLLFLYLAEAIVRFLLKGKRYTRSVSVSLASW